MSNYCPTCGSKTYPDSVFCENCGSKLTPKTSRGVDLSQQKNSYRDEFTNRTSASPYSSTTPQYRYRKKPHNRLGWVIGIIIISIVGFSILSMFVTGLIPLFNSFGTYEYVGTHDYSITNDNFTQVDVIIDNSIGDVNVFYVEDSLTALDAQINVYAKNQRDLSGSDGADIGAYSADHSYFQFTPYSDSSWNSDYKYDIDLYILITLKTNLQIDVSTGSIMVDVHDVELGEVFLETSTGSIEAFFTNILLNNSQYNNYQIVTSTGSIDTRFHNVSYTDNGNTPHWSISASTGTINFELFQWETLNSSVNIEYDVSTSTGSVTCSFGLNDSIGYYLDASTSLGDIIIEGFNPEVSLPYHNEEYQAAPVNYVLILSTSTGSIEIYYEAD